MIVVALIRHLCSIGCRGEEIIAVAHSGGSAEGSEESGG